MKIKASLMTLQAYEPNERRCDIKLDANESPNYLFADALSFQDVNVQLYPDSNAVGLCEDLAKWHDVNPQTIMVGNGSSELIELLIKTYVEPGAVVLSFDPSFSMYEIYSQILGSQFIKVPSEVDFSLDMNKMITTALSTKPSIIFICTPNNPTGYLIDPKEIERLLNQTDALVVVDEAYMEFTDATHSMMRTIESYQNLVVLRTFSKAFGLAGIRLGYLRASLEIVSQLKKVKAPYNLNTLTQTVGRLALLNIDQMIAFTNKIAIEREKQKERLQALGFIVYPSEANFLFVESNLPNLNEQLALRGICIRTFQFGLKTYHRITIGTEEENLRLIQTIKELNS